MNRVLLVMLLVALKARLKAEILLANHEVAMNPKSQSRIGIVSRFLLNLILLGSFQVSIAQDFVWAPDLPIGASVPEISAQDQDGKVQSFDSLKGEKGMLLMMSRSFDW